MPRNTAFRAANAIGIASRSPALEALLFGDLFGFDCGNIKFGTSVVDSYRSRGVRFRFLVLRLWLHSLPLFYHLKV